MYNFIFDADALIKLVHSESLTKICKTFNCVTTGEVKRETVEEGKKRLYPDAEIIEGLMDNNLLKIKNPKKSLEEENRLGKGEVSVLNLSKELKNYIIISDDQTFLKKLEQEKTDFLVPADLIILLERAGKIDKEEANDYLDKIKVFIREEKYRLIKNKLEEK